MRTGPIFALATRKMFAWDTEKTARWLMLYGLGMAVAPAFVVARTVAEAACGAERRGLEFCSFVATSS